MYRILFISTMLTSLITSEVKTQDIIVGVKYGIGSGKYLKASELKEIEAKTMSTLGATVAYSPFFSKMAFTSGVMYEFSPMVEYIAIPLGTRVFIGNKFRFLLEGGLQYAFLAKDKDIEYNHIDVLRTEMSTGFEIAPDRRMRIECMFTRKADAKTSLIEERLAPFNQITKINYRFKGYVISASFKLRF